MNDLKAYAEAPTAASSVPPPPDELRQVDRLAMIGRLAVGILRELVDQLGDVERAGQLRAQARRLLSFAEPRAFEREVLDVGTLVEDTVAMLAPAALLRGVVVTVAPASERVIAELGHKQIEQAVVSLIQSAVHACRLGGKVRVAIFAGRDDTLDLVHIDVADDGPPFRPEDRLRLFEPFQNTTPGHEEDGLGLCVAEAIVSEHGGWIEVGCAEDANRFHVCIPRRAGPSQ